MKKIIYLTIAVFLIMQSFAQSPGDTIIVQTFDYSMTYNQAWGPPRDTIAHFPDDPNLTFEKIIIVHTCVITFCCCFFSISLSLSLSSRARLFDF